MVSYSFDLEITPGSMPPILHMAQYDSGRTYTANLKNNGVAFSPTQGSTAKIKGRNPGGVCWEQEATVSGSTVTFTPEGAATDQFGIMPVQLEITKEDTISTLIIIFDIQRAGYTNEEAASSPEFQTALEAAVAAAIEQGDLGFTEDFKQALLACFAHVAWADEHGQDYYDALEEALYPEPEPSTLVSITAEYLQDRPVYAGDDLDVLKVSDDLTVTAHYSDGTSVVLGDDDYTLSGTLTAGTSTITVAYGGKTDTFNVTVTAWNPYMFSLENGQITKVTGATSGNESGHAHEITYNNGTYANRRRSYPTLREGVEPYKDANDNWSDTIYYPIPIPADAIKAKISITPTTQYHGESMYTYEPGTGYTRQADPGWKQGSFTHTFTAGAYDYLTVVSKYDSSGTTYPTEPTALVVEFLTE